jgi:hypothetical protein
MTFLHRQVEQAYYDLKGLIARLSYSSDLSDIEIRDKVQKVRMLLHPVLFSALPKTTMVIPPPPPNATILARKAIDAVLVEKLENDFQASVVLACARPYVQRAIQDAIDQTARMNGQ